jgi:uncharacterized membrane protein YhaH (DUF805 family)
MVIPRGLSAALPLRITRVKSTEGSAMNFGEAVVSGLRNYINFSGRASRSEFWFFMLFCILVPNIGSVGDLFFFSTLTREGIGPIFVISFLALLVPDIALSARRLHDIDRTGWWLLIEAHHYRSHLVARLVLHQRNSRSQPLRFRPARRKIMVILRGLSAALPLRITRVN